METIFLYQQNGNACTISLCIVPNMFYALLSTLFPLSSQLIPPVRWLYNTCTRQQLCVLRVCYRWWIVTGTARTHSPSNRHLRLFILPPHFVKRACLFFLSTRMYKLWWSSRPMLLHFTENIYSLADWKCQLVEEWRHTRNELHPFQSNFLVGFNVAR